MDAVAARASTSSGPFARLELAPPSIGSSLSRRYRLDAMIARGGTSIVYRGTDMLLGEPVAVKLLLHDGLLQTAVAKAQNLGLRQEATAAMRLSHPNILRVFNYELDHPWEFLVMELVPGDDLAQACKRRPTGRLDPLEVVAIGLECLDGLAHAHEHGVLHNDIKPRNLLLTPLGITKLADFGLARLAFVQGRTRGGPPIGTPATMAPERALRQACDARSDLYSLAATLWSIGHGRAPFGSDDGALRHHVHTPLPPSELPQPLDAVLRKALSKQPHERYPDARAMHAALRAARDALQREGPPAPSRDHPDGPPSLSYLELDVDEATPAITAVSREDMVYVPQSTLRSAYGGAVSAVAAFWIDRTPVTNDAYAAYLASTGASPPAHWLGRKPPPHRGDHPVVGVTLDEARSYAAWCGKRLPTSLEWELAARGETLTAFPWGDVWDAARATCREGGARGTTAVGSLPTGATPAGLLDAVGNVWEWTESHPLAPASSECAWVFGGAYRHACGSEGRIPRTAVHVNKSYEYLGFRCAVSGEGDS